MAKAKQRLNQRKSPKPQDDPAIGGDNDAMPAWVIWIRRCAAALLGGLVVYVAYHPSDSVLVEAGDALWFCALASLLWTATMATEPMLRGSDQDPNGNRLASARVLPGNGPAVDLLLWCLAGWMMIAALASCPPGNLREATNEAWTWVAGAAVLTSARRLLSDHDSRVTVYALLCAVATGMAVHALHQQWISLPALRAEYLADPDAVLRAAGVDAPRLSARRMVFANRLLDGGPTATFALANSLAAPLMIGVLIPIGLLRRKRHNTTPLWMIACLIVMLVVCIAALFATRSRSALVACVLAVAWIWLRRGLSTDARRVKSFVTAAAVSGGIGFFILVSLAAFGDEEWMSAAPASLEFRLHYWKSTVLLLLDHPILGAGPGGFQSMYLRYRLPIASEAIADPHNFFFETLAAGGLVAGLLLVLVVVACVFACRRDDRLEAYPTGDDRLETYPTVGDGSAVARWFGIGAGVALGLVWFFALLSGQLPDLQAGMIAVPIAIAAGWTTRLQFRTASESDIRLIGSAILLAIMTHLTVAGGWTVPGVAIVVWLVVGSMSCARQCNRTSDADNIDGVSDGMAAAQRGSPKAALVGLGIGVALLTSLRFESIVPSQESQLALARAEDGARRGMLSRVDSESRRAVEADNWGYEAARWRSEFLRGRLVGGDEDDPAIRRQWQEAMQIAITRSGVNPILLRAAGEQYLHVYQRFGRPGDLAEAERLITAALVENPTELSLVAQAAMIAAEQSDQDSASTLATEARRLSQLGANIVRDLGLQQIMVVRKIGTATRLRPVFAPIRDQFQQRLGLSGEPLRRLDRNNETSN